MGAAPCQRGRAAAGGDGKRLGVRQALGEIVVFVDADVVVPPGALGLIAEEFDRDADLAALFGSYDESPAWGSFLSQYKNLMHHYVHQISSEQAVTFWAGCGAMRRDVFEQFGGKRIRANAIAPGPIETPLLMSWLLNNPEAKKRRLDRIPMGRFGRPEDIVQMALYLASDESTWVNGSVLVVDGGITSNYF